MSPADKRAMTHCVHGHAFDEANTYWTPTGQRRCKTCARNRLRDMVDRRDAQGLTARGTPRVYRRWRRLVWRYVDFLDD